MKHHVRIMSFLLGLGLLTAYHGTGISAEITNTSGAVVSGDCTPMEGMTFICDLKNPEDLVRLGKTQWVVASSFQL